MKAMMNQLQDIPANRIRHQKAPQSFSKADIGFSVVVSKFSSPVEILSKFQNYVQKFEMRSKPIQADDLSRKIRNLFIWMLAPIAGFVLKIMYKILTKIQSGIDDFYRFMDAFFMMDEQELIPVFEDDTVGESNQGISYQHHFRRVLTWRNPSPVHRSRFRNTPLDCRSKYFNGDLPESSPFTGLNLQQKIPMKFLKYFRLTLAGSLNLFVQNYLQLPLKLPFSTMLAHVQRLPGILFTSHNPVYIQSRNAGTHC